MVVSQKAFEKKNAFFETLLPETLKFFWIDANDASLSEINLAIQ